MMKKITMTVVLVLALVVGVCAFPQNARAAGTVTELIVGSDDGSGVALVTGGTPTANVGAAGDAYWYDAAVNTLYLNGADFSTKYYDDGTYHYGLYVEGDLTIEVCDGTNNTFGATGGAVGYYAGIEFENNGDAVTIQGGPAGTGILDVYADIGGSYAFALDYNDYSDGGSLTIKDVTINARAGCCGFYIWTEDCLIQHATVSATADPDCVRAYDGICTEDCDLTIVNSAIQATGPESGIWTGIWMYDGDLSVTDSTVSCTTRCGVGIALSDYDFYDNETGFVSAPIVVFSGTAALTGSSVTLNNQYVGDEDNGYALLADYAVTISGCTVNADSVGDGIWSYRGDLTFGGATKADIDADGIAAHGSPDVNFELTQGGYVQMNGTVTACEAEAADTINLSPGNTITQPVGGTAGMLGGSWYILNSAGVPVTSARVEGPVNPKTSDADYAPYVIALTVSGLLALGAALYGYYRKRCAA